MNWSYGEESLKINDGPRAPAEAADDMVAERLRKRGTAAKRLNAAGDRGGAGE